MAAPRVGARVREGARTGVVVELRPQGMVDVRFEDKGIVERRPAARLTLANPASRPAGKASGSRGKAAPVSALEVYDPTLEQFRAVVQGVYESLVCKETKAAAFKTPTGLRADRKLTQTAVRRLLSKAYAIATKMGQRHGYLEAGTQRPTLKGAALSAARYGADPRFVEKMLGEDAAGKKLAADKNAAHRAENREDYEKTLQLARQGQTQRRVLEHQGGQLRLLTYPRKPNPEATPWEARGERAVFSSSSVNLPPEMRPYADKARALGQGLGQSLRALAQAKDKAPLLGTAADFERRMARLLREASDAVGFDDPRWWESNGKPTSALRTALGTLRALYTRTSEDVQAGRVSNPVKGKMRGVAIAGISYAGTGGASKGSGSGEYTPTTFYATSRVLDPAGIGYYSITLNPSRKGVRDALSKAGGWQLDRTVSHVAYATGIVKDAPRLHAVVGYTKGGRLAPRGEGGRFGAGYYALTGPKAKPGEHFADKKEAEAYARWLDQKAASFLVPETHEVWSGLFAEAAGTLYKVSGRSSPQALSEQAEAEIISRTERLAAKRARGEEEFEDADLWKQLLFREEGSARRAAHALDFKAASQGALPLGGYRTKVGASGKKATEIYEKTLGIFDDKRIPYVLDVSLKRETASTVRTHRRAFDGALTLSKPTPTAEVSRRRKQAPVRLAGLWLSRGESPEKLAALQAEAAERGRKSLLNKIVRLAEIDAEEKIKAYALKKLGATKYVALMAKPRAEVKMRATMPGAFNVPGRAYGEGRRTGFTKPASDTEHIEAAIKIPEALQPVLTREMLLDLGLDDLKEIATDAGLSAAEIEKITTAAERSALAQVIGEKNAISPLAAIEAGTERGERRYKPPKPIREAAPPPRKPAKKVPAPGGLSPEEEKELERLLKKYPHLRKNGAVSTGVRLAKTGGALALRYGADAANAAKKWAASPAGKRAITRIAMTAASLFGAKAVEGGKLTPAQAKLVQRELERQTGHAADPSDVALALQLARK